MRRAGVAAALAAVPRTNAATAPLAGTVLDPVVRLGQALYGAGILPRLRYVDSFAANPVGGLTQDVDTSGVVIFGADADLDRIVVCLAPSLQYIVNPDLINRPNAGEAPRDALVAGLKLVVNGGELVGLPDALPAVRSRGPATG